MDLEEAITLTKLNSQDGALYLLIGWQSKSFETYIYKNNDVWKGKFSSNRLMGFSKNLQIPENKYFDSIRRCLTQNRDDYVYELKSGFFYWKRKVKDAVIIEGFFPVELEKSPNISRPDLIDISLAINRHMNEKIRDLETLLKNVKEEYQRSLKDTEQFLHLKVDMEKALSKKFLNLLNSTKNEVDPTISTNTHGDFKKDLRTSDKKMAASECLGKA